MIRNEQCPCTSLAAGTAVCGRTGILIPPRLGDGRVRHADTSCTPVEWAIIEACTKVAMSGETHILRHIICRPTTADNAHEQGIAYVSSIQDRSMPRQADH